MRRLHPNSRARANVPGANAAAAHFRYSAESKPLPTPSLLDCERGPVNALHGGRKRLHELIHHGFCGQRAIGLG
jgi:hypothetical protein